MEVTASSVTGQHPPAASNVSGVRRTQRERREATIAKLFDAAIATINEIGYARTSVKTIATRAGMSYGALFRHFDTMSDFMAATAREAIRRRIGEVSDRVAAVVDTGGRTDLATALQVQHEMVGSPTHNTILELTVAARTDQFLCESMRSAMADVGPAMVDQAQALVGHEYGAEPADFATLVFMVADLFDGQALQNALREPYPEISERRVDVLHRMLTAISTHPAEFREG